MLMKMGVDEISKPIKFLENESITVSTMAVDGCDGMRDDVTMMEVSLAGPKYLYSISLAATGTSKDE
jgi:hypothetical protein